MDERLEHLLGQVLNELAWIRSEQAELRAEVTKLTQAVTQRPAALPTYVPFTAVPEDERIIDIGGIALSELRVMSRDGSISEDNGVLKNVGKGNKYPRWLVHVPALVERLKCDRDLM